MSITTSAGYDAAGNRTRLTDGNGNATVYTFNSLSLPEQTIEPSTAAYPNLADRTWQVAYDSGGLPVALAEPGGVTRTASYDALGRLTAETGSGTGVTGAARSQDYDLAGNLTKISSPVGDIGFTYNDRGLLTATTAGGQTTSTVSYDVDGRLASRTDADGSTSYTYDARSNLATVAGAATGGTRAYTYDNAGQLTGVDYHGGTGAKRQLVYDQLGRVTSDTLTGASSSTLRAQTYAYDSDNNLTSTTISGTGVAGAGTQSYTYDWANRVTSWTNQASTTTSYGWDAAGNRTSAGGSTATYDARNRLTSNGSTSYTYSARGTRATATTGSTVTTTAFDAFDRLVSSTTGSSSTSYTYDGLDRIAARTHTGSGSFNFLYDGVRKEPAKDGTSSLARGPDGTLLATGTGSSTAATLENSHGDVVATFTTDGTSLTSTKSYDPFGTVNATGGTTDLKAGYQGSWTDSDTGLVEAEARWYDPATATFLSRDTYPLPWTGTAADNRYTYAAANPIIHGDATGQRVDTDAERRATEAASGLKCNNYGECAKGVAPSNQRVAPISNPAPTLSDAQWAGIAAALAFKQAYKAKYPGLSDDAYNQMVGYGPGGDTIFWNGVRASLAYQAAKQSLATQNTAKLAALDHYDQKISATNYVKPATNKFEPNCGGALEGKFADAIEKAYGEDVADGVDYMASPMHDGTMTSLDHEIPGIGHDLEALAGYLDSWRGSLNYLDTTTGAKVAYDMTRGTLIVQNSYMIYAYQYSYDAFATNGRYVLAP
ncbi:MULTISPECIES: RHS repeat-associated core domain-containing protein [unclassified Frankia]|uniref:RHS repeat-associated core domain-containing protein n=1 Tax=unclassified Frankia TaxID=2632575 RepID=UPI0027DD17FC|nr:MULTISPECIES: RHS repeat-associated core domain-containing protein [unclassified Frankia]